MSVYQGQLSKMQVKLDAPVSYSLVLGEVHLPLNDLLGKEIRLRFEGVINCIHCQRLTKKSFSQGHCYPCFKKLARCDTCILSPEKCHYDAGTCREPEWGEQFCMTDHIVYLANSSGIKVGITRASQLPTRWIDQGAIQALPILRVHSRYQSGLVEDVVRRHVSDKTNWRAMLKGDIAEVDLSARRTDLLHLCETELKEFSTQFGIQAFQRLDVDVTNIEYPVIEHPAKVVSFNLDKTPEVSGRLMGIKGQYLILDSGVLNIRKFTAYQLIFEF